VLKPTVSSHVPSVVNSSLNGNMVHFEIQDNHDAVLDQRSKKSLGSAFWFLLWIILGDSNCSIWVVDSRSANDGSTDDDDDDDAGDDMMKRKDHGFWYIMAYSACGLCSFIS